MRILVAEDDLVSRRLMEASLANWGHEVISASDGAQACLLLQSGGIDICILDWDMPRMDGVEVCRWLRAARLNPEPHVIVLTAKSDPENVRAAYNAGANDYMTKPFDRIELRRRLLALGTQESSFLRK